MCGKYFSEMITAEKWFPFSSALFPLLFLLDFYFKKMQRRKLANKNLDHRIFEIDFCDLLFEKIELADLDLLILKSRNDGLEIWKSDFGNSMIQKLWYLFSHVLFFLGAFSASFSSLVFLILKMEKKAGGEMHKTKMRTRKI